MHSFGSRFTSHSPRVVRIATFLSTLKRNQGHSFVAQNLASAAFKSASKSSGFQRRRNALEEVSGANGELLQLGKREIYVYYGDGMVDTKLKIPAAKNGTARNMNIVAKLTQMAAGLA